jgi:hypothetical protein
MLLVALCTTISAERRITPVIWRGAGMKFILTILLGSAFLLSFAVSTESLACHKGVTHGKNPDPDPCTDPSPPPDDSGTPPTPVDTYAWWFDDATNALRDQDIPDDGDLNPYPDRPCTPENLQPKGNAGSYHCWHVPEKWNHPVTFAFAGKVGEYGLSTKRGEAALCEAPVNGMAIIADGLFNYTWEGNCKETDGCLIRIINWFNGQQVTDAVAAAAPGTSPIRRIVLQGLSNIKLGSDDDLNPFFARRFIDVDTINIDFVGVGTNRSLARCTYAMSLPALFETVPR